MSMYYADLHIHSRFSRATSKDITIDTLSKYAKIKGLTILGTGDFTFPVWFGELEEGLKEDGTGILKSKSGFNFILSTEVSNVYMQDKKQRRIHNIILAPNFDVVEQINAEFLKHGRLDYDGRPIFGFSCVELVEMLKNIDSNIEIIPAHCLTPWYGIFGSKSGFDSIEECFQDQAKHVYALETGLSAIPSMIWRVSKWSDYTLVSFSDSHSAYPWRIGREATVFDIKELSYNNIVKAIRTGDGLSKTLEFFPEEGKYHYDGHRDCRISLNPEDSEKLQNICPVCGRPLTIGVLHRVESLADREAGFVPKNAKPFRSLIPLSEIISFALKSNLGSGKVWEEYSKLANAFGSEFNVLLEADEEGMKRVVDERIAELVLKVRSGNMKIKPGYDGVYGELVTEDREIQKTPQRKLSDF